MATPDPSASLFHDQIVTELPKELEIHSSPDSDQELSKSELTAISGGFLTSTFSFKQPVTTISQNSFKLMAVI
jgi:hypothetical protein